MFLGLSLSPSDSLASLPQKSASHKLITSDSASSAEPQIFHNAYYGKGSGTTDSDLN